MTSPLPRSRPESGAPRWRSWLAATWTLVAAVVSAVGTAAALRWPGPLVTFVLAGMLGLVVGGFTFAFGREDLAGLRRAARAGAWFAGTTVVTIGLGALLGVWSALVLTALLGTSPLAPAAVRLVRRRAGHLTGPAVAGTAPVEGHGAAAPHAVPPPVGTDGGRGVRRPVETVGGVDMTEFELALLDAEQEAGPSPAEDPETPLRAAELDDLCRMWRRTSVLLRQRLDGRRLTEVLDARQHCLDELLRRYPSGTRAWLDAVGTRADDPRPYLTQEPEAI